MENAEPALETISELNLTPGDEEVTTLVSRAVFVYSIISYYELVQSDTSSVGTRPRFWGSLQIPNLPNNHHPLPASSGTSCHGVLSAHHQLDHTELLQRKMLLIHARRDHKPVPLIQGSNNITEHAVRLMSRPNKPELCQWD